MTQKEVLEYNKMCAEFLGAIYSKHAEAWGFGNAVNIGSKEFNGIMYEDVIQAQRFEKDLKFHSDWNWIMEVKNQICNSPKVDEFNTSYDSVANGYHCEILPAHNNTFEPFRTRILPSEREAVVQAIYNFLIWYNQNNKDHE